MRLSVCLPTSRITSNKIRIETDSNYVESLEEYIFQNNIQQNKDWNVVR